MKVSDHVWNMVNRRRPLSGFLATSDGEGNCEVACSSSLELSDSGTMTMLTGDNRTLANLKENPRAAFVVAAGESLEDADGCRVYLVARDITEEGPVIEKGREIMERLAGPEASGMVKAFVTFDVVDVEPLADTGQGS